MVGYPTVPLSLPTQAYVPPRLSQEARFCVPLGPRVGSGWACYQGRRVNRKEKGRGDRKRDGAFPVHSSSPPGRTRDVSCHQRSSIPSPGSGVPSPPRLHAQSFHEDPARRSGGPRGTSPPQLRDRRREAPLQPEAPRSQLPVAASPSSSSWTSSPERGDAGPGWGGDRHSAGG